MTTPDRAAAPPVSAKPITTPLAERLRALMAKATPGPWNSRGVGGHSEITTTAKPSRNDTRIPRYAYGDEEKYSLAYPFLQDRREGGYDVRLDFVCFSHGDAALISTLVNNLPAPRRPRRARGAERGDRCLRSGARCVSVRLRRDQR